jgi:putative endopeptidase
MTRVERRDPPKLYHKMSVEELQKLAPAFGWNSLFHKNRHGIAGIAQRRDARLLSRHE